jgi:uncharacterized membrane protein
MFFCKLVISLCVYAERDIFSIFINLSYKVVSIFSLLSSLFRIGVYYSYFPDWSILFVFACFFNIIYLMNKERPAFPLHVSGNLRTSCTSITPVHSYLPAFIVASSRLLLYCLFQC